jgi:hypothetical protein
MRPSHSTVCIALFGVLLAGCASAPQSADRAVSPANPPTAKPVTASPLIGVWEGKWSIDGLGYEGRARLTIERVEGEVVIGRSTMFATPFGDLTETFAPARFDGQQLTVQHPNARYTLTFDQTGKPLRLSGPLTYSTEVGTYTGRIDVAR